MTANCRIRIKSGWDGAGRLGDFLGSENFDCNGQYWTPVLWDNEEDPDFHKTAALEFFIYGAWISWHSNMDQVDS